MLLFSSLQILKTGLSEKEVGAVGIYRQGVRLKVKDATFLMAPGFSVHFSWNTETNLKLEAPRAVVFPIPVHVSDSTARMLPLSSIRLYPLF